MAKVPLSASVDEEVRDEIEKMAQEQDRSISYITEKVIEKGLEILREQKQK